MRTGVRLAVDVGSARIGVARSDREGLLASPLATVSRGSGDLDAIASLAGEDELIEIIVGLPTSLSTIASRLTLAGRASLRKARTVSGSGGKPVRSR